MSHRCLKGPPLRYPGAHCLVMAPPSWERPFASIQASPLRATLDAPGELLVRHRSCLPARHRAVPLDSNVCSRRRRPWGVSRGLLLYVIRGAPGRTRTRNHWVRSPVLYPLSYGRSFAPVLGALLHRWEGERWCTILWGERRGSNPRSPGPQPGALTTWPRSPCHN